MRYYSNNRTTKKTRNYIKRNYKNIIEGKKNQHKKLKKKIEKLKITKENRNIFIASLTYCLKHKILYILANKTQNFIPIDSLQNL
jgi:hypothetical protein